MQGASQRFERAGTGVSPRSRTCGTHVRSQSAQRAVTPGPEDETLERPEGLTAPVRPRLAGGMRQLEVVTSWWLSLRRLLEARVHSLYSRLDQLDRMS